MIIKEDVLHCTYFAHDFREEYITFDKLVEHRNKHNAPEFEFKGLRYYAESMEVEYYTNEYHIMRAILVKEAKGGKSIDRFNLEVDYNAKTMKLEEI